MPNNGYIGRSPGDSSVIVARESFTPGAATTDFTFASGYTVGYIDCYLNGVRQVYGTDYTASNGTTVGLTSFAQSGDVLELVAYKSFNVANLETASGNFTVGNKLTVSGVSSFTDVVSSGIITADSFSGNLSGSTVSSSGPLTISDTTASTTTTTGALIVSGGVGIAKSLFVGEGISIAGTITYNDVTNVDSIGIVTAGKGFRATTGGVIVTAGVSTFANHIIVGTGLSIAGVTTSHKARFGVVGASGTSLHVHGDARITGVVTATSFIGSGANLTSLPVGGGNSLSFNDGVGAYWGNSTDLQIYHTGGDYSYIKDNSGRAYLRSNRFYMQNNAGDENLIYAEADDAVYLYFNGTKQLETTATGVSIAGTVSDIKGSLRTIPKVAKTSSYTLVESDVGKCVSTDSGVTVPNSVFAAGDAVTIWNDSSSSITITQGTGFQLRKAGETSTGNVTLTNFGLATIWWNTGGTAVITGNLA